jgi:hypothetical protein
MSSIDHTIWWLSWPLMEDIQATVCGKLLVFSFCVVTMQSSLSEIVTTLILWINFPSYFGVQYLLSNTLPSPIFSLINYTSGLDSAE